MKYRLFNLCSKYWEKKNPGKDYPFAMTRTKEEGKVKISLRRWEKEPGRKYAVIYSIGSEGQSFFFRTAREAFSKYLEL